MFTLFDYQSQDTDFLASHNKLFLLSEVGTGKTAISISAHRKLGGKFICFVETNKLFDWKLEYQRWAPNIKQFFVSGDRSKRHEIYSAFSNFIGDAILIVNHHKIFPDLDLFLKINVDNVIIDEVDVFNNSETKLHLYMKWILRNKKICWLLSAYPFGVNLLQFYNLFLLIDLPIFGGAFNFIEKFCILEEKQFFIRGRRIRKKVIVGAKNLEEFKKAIVPYCIRRSKKDAGIILPPIVFKAYGAELTDRQRYLYNLAKKNKLDLMSRQERFEPIAKYAFLTQILDCPFLLDEKESKVSPKIDEVIKLFNKLKDKVVIYSQFSKWHTELINRFSKENIPVISYHGGLSAREKSDAVNSFESASRPLIFLCTSAANKGINLQFCSNLFILDFPFNPIDSLQLFGRLDRIGQHRQINIFYFFMQDTIEEHIFEVLFSRTQLIDQVLLGNNSASFDLQKIFSDTIRFI